MSGWLDRITSALMAQRSAPVIAEVPRVMLPNPYTGFERIPGFHGTPIREPFEQFSIHTPNMGQAGLREGVGTYIASKRPFAASFMGTEGSSGARYSDPMQANAAQRILAAEGDRAAAKQTLLEQAQREGWGERKVNMLLDAIDAAPGRMYETTIKAHPDQLLNWNTILGQQPYVRQQVEPLLDRLPAGANPERMTGEEIYHVLSGGGAGRRGTVGRQRELSEKLDEAGIPGATYLEENPKSRFMDPAQASTRNYVIYNPPKTIDIMRSYGIAGAVPFMGAAAAVDAYGIPRDPNYAPPDKEYQ